MSYLFGDSTDSKLEVNYIEFLRDALDLAVAVLLSDSRVRAQQNQTVARKDAAEAELERLKFLSQNLKKALDESAVANTDSVAGKCVGDLRKSVAGSVQAAANQVKKSLADELKSIAASITRERGTNAKALEKLLLKHDLPQSAHRVEVRLSGNSYEARMSGSSKMGVSWILDLSIPEATLFDGPIRVEKITESLEVKLPDKNSWSRKSGKLKVRAQKLTNKYVTGLVHGPNESRLRLRQNPDDGDTGYDINFSTTPSMSPVQVIRIKNGDVEGAPYDTNAEDNSQLLALRAKLLESAKGLTNRRRALVEARVDNKLLADHENPASLAQRLVTNMAPLVQQIAQHSLSPNELVLKRVLADDRREEIFVSKADLLKKLRPVPVELRGVFAPLGLGNLEADRQPAGNGARSKPSSMVPPLPPGAGAKPAARTARASQPPPTISGEEAPTQVNVAAQPKRKSKDTASAAEKALESLGDD